MRKAILERIERLVQVKVLQEAGDGKYEFTHDIIRENAYRLNNESRRRQELYRRSGKEV